MPLPDMPFHDQLDVLRSAYTNGIDGIMDNCLSHVLLPRDQEMLCVDAAQFLIFILVIKTMENNRVEPTLSNAMQPFRRFVKHIEKEVPGMLQEYILAARAERAAANQPTATDEE